MENQETYSSEPIDVPAPVYYAMELNDSSRSIYITLIEYAGKFSTRKHIKVTQNQLAEELDCSLKTISRGLHKLADLKLIEIIEKPGCPNEYRLLNVSDALVTPRPFARDKKGFVRLI